MPIVPRFVGQPDPSQAPEQTWAQGIQQAALAGEQLRRMGLEATLSKERLAMEKERQGLAMQQGQQGLEIGRQNLAMNAQTLQANQQKMDASQDFGRVADYQMQRAQDPFERFGGPVSPQEMDRLEEIGAQKAMEQIKTPEGKALFAQTYIAGRKEREVTAAFEQTQGRLQNLLLGVAQMPAAKTFQPQIETLAVALDQLDNPGMTPEDRSRALGEFNKQLGDVQGLIRSESLRMDRFAETLAMADAKRRMFPPGHPNRELFDSVFVDMQLNPNADPDEYIKRMGAAEIGLVEHPLHRKMYVQPERVAEEMRLRDQLTNERQMFDARLAAGETPTPFERARMDIMEFESQFYTDKETGQKVSLYSTVRSLDEIKAFNDFRFKPKTDVDIDAGIEGAGLAPAAAAPQAAPAAPATPAAPPAPSVEDWLGQGTWTPEGNFVRTPEAEAKRTEYFARKKAEEEAAKEQQRKDAAERRKASIRSRTRGIGG